MNDIATALKDLRSLIATVSRREQEREDFLRGSMNDALKAELLRDLENDIEKFNIRMASVLENLTRFPPCHLRHQQKLQAFHENASYEKSIFIMTKFPNIQNPSPEDLELESVIKTVRNAVVACGYEPRIANDHQYHPLLWDNVELYLLGCQRGIAIVEDKYLPELNPNVAMEWGWMRGMGRNVLYLVEKSFTKPRADWSGLIEYPFEWNKPDHDIPGHIQQWLQNAGQ